MHNTRDISKYALSVSRASSLDIESPDFCIIFHGVFGMASNVMPIARIVEKISSQPLHIYCVDMPNHGDSPALQPCDYPAMVKTVDTLIAQLCAVHDEGDQDLANQTDKRKIHIMGHSMGGKLAMAYALEHPQTTTSLTVFDIAPKAYISKTDKEMDALVEIINSKPTTRNDIRKILDQRIDDKLVRLFLLKNFLFEDGKFKSKLNVQILKDNHEQLWSFSDYDPAILQYEGPAMFIGGTKSDYIQKGDLPLIASFFPQSKVDWIEAGHTVHAENPQALAVLMQAAAYL